MLILSFIFRRVDSKSLNIPLKELCKQILRILKAENNANMETELLDLLGFDNIDFVSELVSNQTRILEKCYNDEFKFRDDVGITVQVFEEKRHPGQRVSLMTESAKADQKQLRKLRSKGVIPNLAEDGMDMDRSLEHHRASLRDTLRPIMIEELPNIYTKTSPSIALQGKFTLPAGTEHFDDAIHEEFILPYSQDTTTMDSIKLIQIAELDALLQRAFSVFIICDFLFLICFYRDTSR